MKIFLVKHITPALATLLFSVVGSAAVNVGDSITALHSRYENGVETEKCEEKLTFDLGGPTGFRAVIASRPIGCSPAWHGGFWSNQNLDERALEAKKRLQNCENKGGLLETLALANGQKIPTCRIETHYGGPYQSHDVIYYGEVPSMWVRVVETWVENGIQKKYNAELLQTVTF